MFVFSLGCDSQEIRRISSESSSGPGFSLSAAFAANPLSVASAAIPGAGSSATLPVTSATPKVVPLERLPTVPPRPFLHTKDSIETNKKKLMDSDRSHKLFQDARSHPHQPRIFVEKSIDEVENKEDNAEDDDGGECEPDYITHEEVNKFYKQQSESLTVNEDEGGYSHSADELDDDDEDPYMEFVEEKVVLLNTFTKSGGHAKMMSLHIRVPPESLSGDADQTCSLSLSTVWSALPSLPGDEDCVPLCPVVSCTSFPSDLRPLKPFSLEIQHCGVLKDVNTCKPKLWCMRSVPGMFSGI